MKVTSQTSNLSLRPVVMMAAYRHDAGQTADIYLTDLSREHLYPEADLRDVSGSIIHVHLFLVPRAGRSPMEPTSTNATVRYIIVSRGKVGVYAGGGFLRPRSGLGSAALTGTMRRGSLRLASRSEGFEDHLGNCTIDLAFRAPRDEGLARLMAARLESLLAGTDQP